MEKDDEIFLCELTIEEHTMVNDQDPRVQPLLKEYSDVFPEEIPPGLPPKQVTDYRIKLEPGNRPPWHPIYRMSPLKLDTMRKELDKLLKLGSIEPSLSPFGTPVIFVKKKNGDL